MFDSYADYEPTSKQWLIQCLDPFHDTAVVPSGYPDLCSAPSTTVCYSSSVTVTAPAAAAGGTWDAHVCFTGMDDSIVGRFWRVSTANYVPIGLAYDHVAPPGALNVYPLTILTGASGADISITSETAARTGLVTRNNSVDSGRLIAVGFEVHNTTANVYKQGNLTVSQSPGVRDASFPVNYRDTNAAPWPDAVYEHHAMSMLSSTPAQLRAIPGSGQWAAAQGCYVIPRIHSQTMKPVCTALNPGSCYFSDGSNTHLYAMPEGSIGGYPAFDTNFPSSFIPAQVMLTGLSTQTTLNVTLRAYVEYFPMPISALLTSAAPSPSYDPKALAVYNAVARVAPYAVPVSENAGGDYFKTILSILKTLGSAALTAWNPYLGAAATAMSNVVTRPNKPTTPRRKKSQQQQNIQKQTAGAGARTTRP